jgi:hypothetical protein
MACSGATTEICGDSWANSVYISSCALNPDLYLTHHWPICNGLMKDANGSADMIQGSLTSFVTDRFGNADSALALNGGWTQVPSGMYFDSPQFTITAWIYPQTFGFCSRVIDFGNGPASDNILLAFECGSSLLPAFGLYSGSILISQFNSGQALTLNTWQFLAATYDGSNMYIYINGVLLASDTFVYYALPSMIRVNNYIGKSNWAVDGYTDSYVDDLRFYRISLTQSQINTLMNQPDTSSTLSACQLTTTSATSTTTTTTTTSTATTTITTSTTTTSMITTTTTTMTTTMTTTTTTATTTTTTTTTTSTTRTTKLM